MERYINDYGVECYKGIKPETLFDDLVFHEVDCQPGDTTQYALHTNIGSLTVVDRMTGFGWRGIETGYRDTDGKFWLATGNIDVRESGVSTIEEAVEWVKNRANTCVGI